MTRYLLTERLQKPPQLPYFRLLIKNINLKYLSKDYISFHLDSLVPSFSFFFLEIARRTRVVIKQLPIAVDVGAIEVCFF